VRIVKELMEIWLNEVCNIVTSTSIGIPIDRAGGGGFGVTGKGRMGGNLTTNKGGGQVEIVLGGAEGAEYNID